jgi:hypothetical protein
MANIPTVALTAVPTAPQLGVRIDPGSVAQSARAIAQAGGALQQVGDMLGRFAMQKQEQVNKGILAQEDSIRARTEAEVDSFVTNNPDKPEEWERFRSQAWKSYESERAQRAKAEKWGTAVMAQDKAMTETFRTQTDIRFKATLDKGLIRQSNARLEASASTYLEAGNVDGAVKSINEMTLYPEQRQQKIETVTNGVAYNQYNRRLSEVAQLPPAQRLQELQSVAQELDATDADGAPVNGVFYTSDGKRLGGLRADARTDLLQQARAKLRAADNEVMSEIGDVARSYEFGLEYGLQVWRDKIDQGAIPKTADDKTGYGGVLSRLYREAEMRITAEETKTARGQQKKFTEEQNNMLEREQMLDRRIPEGRLTEEDVIAERKRGEITEQGAQQLLARLNAFADVELKTAWKNLQGTANRPVSEDVRGRIMAYASMPPEKKDKVGSSDRKAMLAHIDYLPISAAAKAKLVREFVQASQVDIIGWEKGKLAKFDGRRVDAVESDARNALYEVYKRTPNTGQGWAGTLLMDQEALLTEFFTSDQYEKMTPSEKVRAARELVNEQKERVALTATGLVLGNLY